jgi:ribonuclease-3
MRPNSSHTGKRRKNRSRGARKPPSLAIGERETFEQLLGRRFRIPDLLDRALTHRSAAQGQGTEWSNERLEFLGDRVLGLVIARHLLERFPLAREGELAPKLNAVVSRDACARIGDRLGVAAVLMVDPAERATDGSLKASLISNAVEAVLGAVFLDAGYVAAEQLILRHWKDALQETESLSRDPKTELQEWAQGEGRPTPTYRHVGRDGPDHAPRFFAYAIVAGFEPAPGEGPTKQDAERAAARAFLQKLATGAEAAP